MFDFSTCAFDALLPPLAPGGVACPLEQDELLALTTSINAGVLEQFSRFHADPSSPKTMTVSLAKAVAKETVKLAGILVPPVLQVGLGLAEKVAGQVRAELRRRAFYADAAPAIDAYLATLTGRRFLLCDAVLTPFECADLYLRRNKVAVVAAEGQLLGAVAHVSGDSSTIQERFQRMREVFVARVDEAEARACDAAARAEALVDGGMGEMAAAGGLGASVVDAVTAAAKMTTPALFLLP